MGRLDKYNEKNMLNTMAKERIGDFMLRVGAMTQEQVENVLQSQKQEPDKVFGVIAIEKGYIDDKILQDYIESQ